MRDVEAPSPTGSSPILHFALCILHYAVVYRVQHYAVVYRVRHYAVAYRVRHFAQVFVHFFYIVNRFTR